MTDRELRLFAVWCARTLQEVNNSEILTNTVNVAEKFADNLAIQEELGAAWCAARGAAWGAARGAQIQKLIEFFSTENYVWVNNAK